MSDKSWFAQDSTTFDRESTGHVSILVDCSRCFYVLILQAKSARLVDRRKGFRSLLRVGSLFTSLIPPKAVLQIVVECNPLRPVVVPPSSKGVTLASHMQPLILRSATTGAAEQRHHTRVTVDVSTTCPAVWVQISNDSTTGFRHIELDPAHVCHTVASSPRANHGCFCVCLFDDRGNELIRANVLGRTDFNAAMGCREARLEFSAAANAGARCM
eukprot:6461572-Amphidinium_carterae.1